MYLIPAFAGIDSCAVIAGLDYGEEALKTIGFIPEWQSGLDTNARVGAGLSVRPETRTFIADYIKNANK